MKQYLMRKRIQKSITNRKISERYLVGLRNEMVVFRVVTTAFAMLYFDCVNQYLHNRMIVQTIKYGNKEKKDEAN